MLVQSDLIYDVGAAYGDDSAYYLHKGYRVLAVEPNPLALAHLGRRFESEIRERRLTLVPRAVAADAGEAVFWVCDDDPNISSFDRAQAGHNGASHHEIVVQTCQYSALAREHGVPYYCKIDIEGSDADCLADVTKDTRPPFISAELLPGDRHIERLRDLGYTRFKILSQRTFRSPNRALTALKSRIPRRLSRTITKVEERFARQTNSGCPFLPYSSGPFGHFTPGNWQSADDALTLQRLVERNPDGSDWFDVHAALPEDEQVSP